MGFSLRVATLADEGEISRLIAVSYGELYRPGYDADLLAKALPLMTRANPKLLTSGTYHVVVDASGAFAGCGGWTREEPGTGVTREGVGHIRHVAVHPDFTRQGVGRLLMEHCFNESRASGMQSLECFASLVSVAFYEAVGFTAIRPVPLALPGDIVFPGVLMRRAI